MKLAISLATRGRPQQLVETVKRSVANWTHPETEMWIQLDEDDQASIDAVNSTTLPKNVFVVRKDREDTIAAKWNRILEQCPDADVYSVAADDDPYITPGYDSAILEAAARLPGGIGMVYGNLANLSFPGSISATRRWCDILGYLQPEHFPYWFCDHWTDDLVRITGLFAFADIWTDQSKVGKTQEMREPAWWATFYDLMYMTRRSEASRLLRASERNIFARERLHRNAKFHENRSIMINNGIRQQAAQLSAWSGLTDQDERYQRVKNRAIKMADAALRDPAIDKEIAAWAAQILFPPPLKNLQQAYA